MKRKATYLSTNIPLQKLLKCNSNKNKLLSWQYWASTNGNRRQKRHVPQTKRDNLVVETDIIWNLGVSFCVTQNAFNFIKLKNKNIGEQFSKSSIPLCNTFLKGWWSCCCLRFAQNNSSLRRLHFYFWWFLDKKYFLQN